MIMTVIIFFIYFRMSTLIQIQQVQVDSPCMHTEIHRTLCGEISNAEQSNRRKTKYVQ